MRRLVAIDAARTLTLNGVDGETFVINMVTSITRLRAKYFTPGVLYVLIFKQTQAGGQTVEQIAEISNGTAIDSRPFAVTVQSYIADIGGVLRAHIPGTWGLQ
jgi:hypothetical protein